MDNIKDIIRENYGIVVLGVEKIKNVYKVKTENGLKCFKASKYDVRQFDFIINSVEHLTNKGFKGVLPIYKTLDGRKYVKTDTGYGFLCDWIESREASFKNPVELKKCVETLSELHLTSRDFKMEDIPRVRKYYGRWQEKFSKRCNELIYFKALIASKEKRTEFDNIYLKYFDIHYRQGLRAISDIEGSRYKEIMKEHELLAGLCHHDTANHNFLVTGDFNIKMIDFDYCIFDTHLHDLGSIIIRNLKYDNWERDILKFILEVYQNKIPLSRDELYIILCFMEFPQDFWQVGLQYYVEKQPWEEEFFLRKLNRTVLDSKNRMEFIEDLKINILEGYYV